MEDIVLLGTGGHAHSVVDSIEQTGKYNIIGFLDTEEMLGRRYKDYQVIDTDAALEKYYKKGLRNAFITIGYLGRGDIRNRLYERIHNIGYTIPNIIDRTAIVADNVVLGEGIFIGKRAVINANASIGEMCIINTGAIVEHDCCVESFAHISVGSVLCGGVHVGKASFVGANATIIQYKTIGSRCIIGAGITVRKDVEDGELIKRHE